MTHSAVGYSEYSLQEYYEKDSLSEECQKKVGTTDILIMPYKYNEEFYFADETVSFYKFCKSRNVEYNIDILADENVKVRSLHSFDIWMPLIFVATNILLPIAINIVSDYIIQKRKGREDEPCDVDITFKVKHGDDFKELRYKGSAEAFKDNFEKIDINNL
ncbi:hypothetical protein ACWJXL_15680 [Clostridioides difficile]|uniref:hypothetical protein n=1 Tax=Clostridioides difficile TaxID=1496 RepID=UPI00107142AF|nr:hypothetical protein [Clostridioides difficile]HBG7268150.1 hypothetical protein [Clostridioides difficile]HBH1374258.1 hypothetical protein [Clostridioides difficile]HBH1378236.1 hypothetical protein [Clostridioides difficile]HBH1385637.1 hypothetical protein [Clostridioides difficile]